MMTDKLPKKLIILAVFGSFLAVLTSFPSPNRSITPIIESCPSNGLAGKQAIRKLFKPLERRRVGKSWLPSADKILPHRHRRICLTGAAENSFSKPT